jgi:hypothetical protein
MNILSAADARGVAPNLNGLGQSYGRVSGDENEPAMMWAANNAGSMPLPDLFEGAAHALDARGIVGDGESNAR